MKPQQHSTVAPPAEVELPSGARIVYSQSSLNKPPMATEIQGEMAQMVTDLFGATGMVPPGIFIYTDESVWVFNPSFEGEKQRHEVYDLVREFARKIGARLVVLVAECFSWTGAKLPEGASVNDQPDKEEIILIQLDTKQGTYSWEAKIFRDEGGVGKVGPFEPGVFNAYFGPGTNFLQESVSE